MTKRKVSFKTPSDQAECSEMKSRRFMENQVSDSDEEDSDGVESAAILNDEDIEGQEEETVRDDDGIVVTPFNLKDELEEGHFDAQGNYIANKVDENITDGWLDSVDWSKVPSNRNVLNEDSMEDLPDADPLKMKKDMLSFMNPGETVLKSLRRLGGNKKPISSADRWKKKKANVPIDDNEAKSKESMLKLTGLADDVLQSGDFQIYEKSYEQLAFETKDKLSSQFENAEEQDDEDELEAAFRSADQKNKDNQLIEKVKSPPRTIETKKKDEVLWEYRLENKEESEVFGCFTSSQMLALQDAGKFEKDVFCRKVDSNGPFYSSKRIDFELYI
ncbi:CD2 antigen cytoplasmic tail-binding protein 2 homolog [Hydra vulgaris]|uniref:CD2 antigen cytoplasmic tail-binding protein 2 n=1 Tax=Hydra vulgaris TaxID=6087 RepID=T2MHR9_HYDVU|nr:CD2 antigen cytoplasmic tail-binding protein 2 homolog [Hydra vulgaris]